MRKLKPLPPQERLRELLDYNPLTGVLRWRTREGDAVFNGRHAGRVALGCPGEFGHLAGDVDGVRYLAHRIAWKWWYGVDPGELDHRDRDSSNNRILNLRDVNHSVNQFNRRRPSGNKSGRCGVVWNKRRRYFQVMYGRRYVAREACLGRAIRRRKAEEMNHPENHL